MIFLACINNAVDPSYNRCWKYVDDLTLGENRLFNQESNIQSNLNQLDEWAKQNSFSLNPAKCQTLQVYFGRKNLPDSLYSISNNQLSCVSSVKLLVVTFQSNLK